MVYTRALRALVRKGVGVRLSPAALTLFPIFFVVLLTFQVLGHVFLVDF